MPPLALLAGVHRVLDLGHLHDQVGRGDQSGSASAAGDHHVLAAGPRREHRDHVVHVDPAPLHRVGELVEHVEAVGLGGQVAARPGPSLRPGVCGVVGLGARLAGSRTSPHPSCARSPAPRPVPLCAESARSASPRPSATSRASRTGTPRSASPGSRPAAPARTRRWTCPYLVRCAPRPAAGCRRCRVVSPSSGTASGCPLGIRRPSADGADEPGERPGPPPRAGPPGVSSSVPPRRTASPPPGPAGSVPPRSPPPRPGPGQQGRGPGQFGVGRRWWRARR